MFSNTIKRSVATLGVVAGLLAAAVPASAMVGGDEADTVTGKAAVLTDYDRNSFSPQAPTSDGLIAVTVDAGSGNDNVKGPTKATAGGISGEEMANAVSAPANTVFTSVSNVFKGEMIGLEPDYALGTQVGNAPSPYVPGQGSASDPTAQGIIMSDGRICNPRWGC